MKNQLLVLLLVTALLFAPMSVEAKPKPPYPPPSPELQTEAYPPPIPGLPGVQDFVPSEPTWPDPRYGIPYFWGIFPDSTGYWRGYVTIWLDYPDFDYEGVMCLMSNNTGNVICYLLYPHNYVSETGYMTYWTQQFQECGFWSGWATLDGIQADIRQPNEYLIKCIFIPQLKKA
jgi:hypothetical protein